MRPATTFFLPHQRVSDWTQALHQCCPVLLSNGYTSHFAHDSGIESRCVIQRHSQPKSPGVCCWAPDRCSRNADPTPLQIFKHSLCCLEKRETEVQRGNGTSPGPHARSSMVGLGPSPRSPHQSSFCIISGSQIQVSTESPGSM